MRLQATVPFQEQLLITRLQRACDISKVVHLIIILLSQITKHISQKLTGAWTYGVSERHRLRRSHLRLAHLGARRGHRVLLIFKAWQLQIQAHISRCCSSCSFCKTLTSRPCHIFGTRKGRRLPLPSVWFSSLCLCAWPVSASEVLWRELLVWSCCFLWTDLIFKVLL